MGNKHNNPLRINAPHRIDRLFLFFVFSVCCLAWPGHFKKLNIQASSPACTELETIVMNWLGKMIGLPDDFLHTVSKSKGGGVIQTTASESTLVCLLAGRTQAIRRFHERTPGHQDSEINARLVAYCSDQAHSSVEKAALIGMYIFGCQLNLAPSPAATSLSSTFGIIRG